MTESKRDRHVKVQIGTRLDPRIIELWKEIDQQEAAGNRTRVLEWCIANGYGYLADQRRKTGVFTDRLIGEHGPQSILTASVSGLTQWSGETPSPQALSEATVHLEINGRKTEQLRGWISPIGGHGDLYPALTDEYEDGLAGPRSGGNAYLAITAAGIASCPAIVLTTFRLDQPLGTVAERLENLPWLPLLDSPGDGKPSEELLKRRRGSTD